MKVRSYLYCEISQFNFPHCVSFLIQSDFIPNLTPSTHSHAHIHAQIYIYIYRVIHRQTVSFYQNSSVWLDTQDARSWDRNPSNFMLDCISDHSATKRTTLTKGILRYFYF